MARSRKKREKKRKRVSDAEKKADRLYQMVRPSVVKMIERNDPKVAGLDFNKIEANAAAVGDLLAKVAMVEALHSQPSPTDAEIARARQEALKKADPDLAAGKKPEQLRMKRIPGREKGLKTARGEIRYGREYLHFPDLKVGMVPPR